MKKIASVIFHRLVVVIVLIVLQVALLAVAASFFGQYNIPFFWVTQVLSAAAVIWVVNSPRNAGYKITWVILILFFPVVGWLFYLLFAGGRLMPSTRRRLGEMAQGMERTLGPDKKAREVARTSGVTAGNFARYLEDYAHSPAYADTRATYYPVGDDCLEPLLDGLKNAKNYIFLEYFIISEGKFWGQILDVLKAKVREGVEVRVIYDDIGSMRTLPSKYPKELAKYGIKCVDFNRFIPVLSTAMNNRDHRKICSIDGTVAFAGGLNLADEYINQKVRFGHWKDSVVRLEGPGAWSMAVMFLTMWGFAAKVREDVERFRPQETPRFPDSGWVQPYTDCPWDREPVGETVYLNLISKAQRYLYICTPYLILNEAMNTALVAAAKSGVDVRLMTPHIPDKKMIFQVTRAHYEPLLRGGVKVYEYTPGFLHSKTFVSDDRFATVGSINLDYRSLFLHFENGVLLTDNAAVLEAKEDFLETVKKCEPYTLSDCRKVALPVRLLRSLLRVFAPLF